MIAKVRLVAALGALVTAVVVVGQGPSTGTLRRAGGVALDGRAADRCVDDDQEPGRSTTPIPLRSTPAPTSRWA